MKDYGVSSSKSRQIGTKSKSHLGQLSYLVFKDAGLRGGKLFLFNMGKVSHPAEQNFILLKQYSEHCDRQVALGKAIPSYMRWLSDSGYVKTADDGCFCILRALPSGEEDYGNKETPKRVEDTKEEL